MFHRPSPDVDSSRPGRWGVLGALALILSLGVPTALQAQAGQGQGQRQSLMKLRQVNRQLNKIQQRAMQDSTLQAQRQELFEYVLSELASLDDSTAARVKRIRSLQADVRSAQQARDTAAMRTAVKELRKLQRAIRPAQKKIMQRPEVRKRFKTFRQDLRARMSEIDPRADSLQAVADSIASELQGGMGGGSGGGSR